MAKCEFQHMVTRAEAVRDFFAARDMENRQHSVRTLVRLYRDLSETAQIEQFTAKDWADTEYLFTRLFVGPGPVPAPLYASVYLEEDALLMGESSLQVRALLHGLGLRSPHEGQEPDDFLPYELDAWLVLEQHARQNSLGSRAVPPRTEPQPVQARAEPQPVLARTEPQPVQASVVPTDLPRARRWFLNKHVCKWLPPFLHRARQNAEDNPVILLVLRALADWLMCQRESENPAPEAP